MSPFFSTHVSTHGHGVLPSVTPKRGLFPGMFSEDEEDHFMRARSMKDFFSGVAASSQGT